MAQPTYTSAQWQRGMRSLIVVSVVSGPIISLLVQWFMGRVQVVPTVIGILAFCGLTVLPSLWLLRRHLEADAQMPAVRLGGRTHR